MRFIETAQFFDEEILLNEWLVVEEASWRLHRIEKRGIEIEKRKREIEKKVAVKSSGSQTLRNAL